MGNTIFLAVFTSIEHLSEYLILQRFLATKIYEATLRNIIILVCSQIIFRYNFITENLERKPARQPDILKSAVVTDSTGAGLVYI